jgi:thiamine transporter
MNASSKTRRLTISAMMIAIAAVMSFLSSVIPFLNAVFGGSFTFGSMIFIVVVSYMFGVRWGIFTGFCYAVLQMLLGHGTIIALFTPTHESYMGLGVAILVCLIDYLLHSMNIGREGGNYYSLALCFSEEICKCFANESFTRCVTGSVCIGRIG